MTTTEVLVELRRPPQNVFHERDAGLPNSVRFRLSPEVIIALGARAKMPGEPMAGEAVELAVRHNTPDEMEPYERLIGDAMAGDTTLFAQEDSVEAAWAIVDPILKVPPPPALLRAKHLGTARGRPYHRAPRWLAQSSAGEGIRPMSTRRPVVFLIDVDNTLLDNDRIAAGLRRHLTVHVWT